MPKLIRLVVDTNVFHECQKLDSPDFQWSAIGPFDPIELVVPEPVQRELDAQKKDERSRVKKRALIANAWLREMLSRPDQYKVLRDSRPRVLLKATGIRPAPEHVDILDYSVNDDRIVGIAAALATADPEINTKLISHDTGPGYKARLIGLEFMFVPDEWLRGEEEDELQKENRDLKDQLRKYQQAGPILNVSARPLVGSEVNLTRDVFAPLTKVERENLVLSIKEEFLVSEIVERAKQIPKQVASSFRSGFKYFPPPQADLDHYENVIYPEWLVACDNELQTVSQKRNLAVPARGLKIYVENVGRQPANNVLIKFTARGPFKIAPPAVDGSFVEAADWPNLPSHPKAPVGRWVGSNNAVLGSAVPIPLDFPSISPPYWAGKSRDPEQFYYDPERPQQPVSEFSLVCELFRHGLAAEEFDIDVFPQNDTETLRGMVEVEVHATNAQKPTVYRQILEIKSPKTLSILDFSRSMVTDLKPRP